MLLYIKIRGLKHTPSLHVIMDLLYSKERNYHITSSNFPAEFERSMANRQYSKYQVPFNK